VGKFEGGTGGGWGGGGVCGCVFFGGGGFFFFLRGPGFGGGGGGLPAVGIIPSGTDGAFAKFVTNMNPLIAAQAIINR